MKPECRRVLSQIASYSVEELSPGDADAFTRHLDDCPPCKGQWLLFEKTLTTLSQIGDADISVEQEQRMWLTCLEHAKNKSHALAQDSSPKVEVLPQPFRSDSSEREGDRRSSHPQSQRKNEIGNIGWLQSLKTRWTPRFCFALASGAAAILAAALFASPAPQESVPAPRVAATLPQLSEVPRLISFQTPPHATTGMIDYHSAMAFEPFSDHVAATLVSYTATQP